ncbi:MAG: zinc-binding dehydrogenase [bacterium]
MKAIICKKSGPSNVMELVDLPVPEPGPGQVRLRVESASVNFSDIMQRRGSVYPFDTAWPYRPGSEVAGVVDALGDDVDSLAVGTRVVALVGGTGNTGYSQYCLADAHSTVPLPQSISADDGCGLMVAGVTAALLIRTLKPGQTVFIESAAGGVGTYAIQLAKRRGAASIYGGTTNASKQSTIAALGAVPVLQSGRWAHDVRGIDLYLSMRGGSLDDALSCLAPGGECVVYGTASGVPTLSPSSLVALLARPALNQSLRAFNLGVALQTTPHLAHEALGELFEGLATGTVAFPETHIYPLMDAPKAHDDLENGVLAGKAVLRPWD